MEPGVFKVMAEVDRDSWYYQGKRAAIQAILRKVGVSASRIVDLGCGTGTNARAIVPFTTGEAEYIGVEPYPLPFRAAEFLPARLLQKDIATLQLTDIGKPANLVMMIDVLEHVDEAEALETVQCLLSPHGYFLLTVPAYRCLWGKSDEDGHHRTRYSPEELRAALTRHGFEIVTWNHYFPFAFLPLLLVSWRQRRQHRLGVRDERQGYFGPQWLGRAVTFWVRIEGKLGQYIHWPWGTGMVWVVRKKG